MTTFVNASAGYNTPHHKVTGQTPQRPKKAAQFIMSPHPADAPGININLLVRFDECARTPNHGVSSGCPLIVRNNKDPVRNPGSTRPMPVNFPLIEETAAVSNNVVSVESGSVLN